MNYLQSLGLSKPQTPMKQNSAKNPSGVQRNNAGVSQPSVPRSSELALPSTDMLEAWMNNGSIGKPTARVAPKNAGKKMDFLG